MAAQANILVVEGTSDQTFFERLCDALGLSATVKVAPPEGVAGWGPQLQTKASSTTCRRCCDS